MRAYHTGWSRFKIRKPHRQEIQRECADRFLAPPPRNVALTPPYGYDGAFATLEGMVRHHLNPRDSLNTYDTSQVMFPSRADLDEKDFVVHSDPDRRQSIADACELEPVDLSEREIGDLIAFLHALTDLRSLDLRLDVPPAVPSGLPVFD